MSNNFLTPGFVPGSVPTKSLIKKPEINRFENRKVPLAIGKSLNDWIRLAASGVDLSGTGGKHIKVTEHDMKQHENADNAWIVLNGRVYSVAKYLEYHPGGVEELMRAAGGDATGLFNEIHPWVAWDSMLKSCLVGPFVGNRENLRPIVPSTTDQPDIGSLTVTDGQNATSSSTYVPCKLYSISSVTHDTNLYVLEKPKSLTTPIPLGSHVYFKVKIDGMELTRPYTPVIDECDEKRSKLHFIIKIYPCGLLTQKLKDLQQGDYLQVSSQIFADFDSSKLDAYGKVHFFAAGTGITPFFRIINQLLSKDKTVQLNFFNKRTKDIIWKEKFDELAHKSSHFHVHNILSDADVGWCGLKGRITKNLISILLDKDEVSSCCFCICGPTGFNDEAIRLLNEMKCTNKQIYLFTG